jgi:hypothetical protein
MWSTLRSRAALDKVVLGTACLLVGSAVLVGSGTGFWNAPRRYEVWGLFWAVVSLLVGMAFLLGGVAFLLLGTPFLLRKPRFGVGFLVGGFGVLMLGVASLLGEWRLGGVAVVLAGLAIVLLGVALLLLDAVLLGVPFVLLGVAGVLVGIAMLYRPELLAQVVAWLTRRDDPPLTADGDHRD